MEGDELWFVSNNTVCDPDNVLAKMTWSDFRDDWMIYDLDLSPVNLLENRHYQVCVYLRQEETAFNMMQVYIAYMIRTIDQANYNAYSTTGVRRTFKTFWGD